MKGLRQEAGRRLLATLLLFAPGTSLAGEARYGYCTWAGPAPGREAFVSTVYAVPADANSVRLARSFADYINAGARDRPRSFTPICFKEFDSEDSARSQRNRELAGYRERGFTLQLVGGWAPPEQPATGTRAQASAPGASQPATPIR